MAGPRRFWMVKGRGPASHMHESRASAEAEAERLARLNPGEPFFVLVTVAALVRRDVERFTFDKADEGAEYPEIPF